MSRLSISYHQLSVSYHRTVGFLSSDEVHQYFAHLWLVACAPHARYPRAANNRLSEVAMKYRKEILLAVVLGSLSCQDATAPRKLRVPHFAHFMQVETDPTCNYVSTQCAYTIDGVTTYGGGTTNPPPLIIWPDAIDPPSIWEWLIYPQEDWDDYHGATVGTTSHYLYPGGTIVEQACDPRPNIDPNCLQPLQPRDSVFLTTVLADLSECILYIRCADEMGDQEMIDQCAQAVAWLQGAINDSFNRPEGITSRGFFRGRNGSGPFDNAWVVHGGITNNGAAHADERHWQIYEADSLSMRRHLVMILMHEAVHMYSQYNHGGGTSPNYADYPYYKYIHGGFRRGCVRL